MNNKQIVRLTENDLHKIVKESVDRVLKEGKKTNNKKDYFRKMYDDNGEEYLRPLSSHAKKDASHEYANDWTDFDVAVDKHNDREIGSDVEDYGGKVGPEGLRQGILAVAKLGIPMEIAYKLNFHTLYSILHQLKYGK